MTKLNAIIRWEEFVLKWDTMTIFSANNNTIKSNNKYTRAMLENGLLHC